MLGAILEKCLNNEEISDEEVAYLLTRKQDREINEIYSAARRKREAYFGNRVFLYGFVYFSTFCKNNCSFCYFRREHSCPERYRKSCDEIVQTAVELKNSGVHLIDLTCGDDPVYTQNPERLAQIVKAVKDESDLDIMVSPGVLNFRGIDMISDAGASWYALYQETHNRELYCALRPGQDYDTRMNSKLYARAKGLLIEEGLLTGVGESTADKIRSLHEMKKMEAKQVRAMTFIEQEGAPLKSTNPFDFTSELLLTASMRLIFGDVLIPASLDVEGLAGLKKRLMAGANVVTSIIPPKKGYAGVANSVRDIDEGYRTVYGIEETLNECGLKKASQREYSDWVRERRKKF